jgi:hypothetical protein
MADKHNYLVFVRRFLKFLKLILVLILLVMKIIRGFLDLAS